MTPPTKGAPLYTLDAIAEMLEAERDKLREALEWCAREHQDGGDIDGGSWQDMMERLGLLVEVPASEAFREDWDCDTMYVLAWSRP